MVVTPTDDFESLMHKPKVAISLQIFPTTNKTLLSSYTQCQLIEWNFFSPMSCAVFYFFMFLNFGNHPLQFSKIPPSNFSLLIFHEPSWRYSKAFAYNKKRPTEDFLHHLSVSLSPVQLFSTVVSFPLCRWFSPSCILFIYFHLVVIFSLLCVKNDQKTPSGGQISK